MGDKRPPAQEDKLFGCLTQEKKKKGVENTIRRGQFLGGFFCGGKKSKEGGGGGKKGKRKKPLSISKAIDGNRQCKRDWHVWEREGANRKEGKESQNPISPRFCKKGTKEFLPPAGQNQGHGNTEIALLQERKGGQGAAVLLRKMRKEIKKNQEENLIGFLDHLHCWLWRIKARIKRPPGWDTML